jgi:hypothetical protein
MDHAYNLSTWEVEAGGPWDQGQPGLYVSPCLKNKTKMKQPKQLNKQEKITNPTTPTLHLFIL